MIDAENDQTVRAAIIVGCCLIIGLTAAGYFIGPGMAGFKSAPRAVTVQGLVEREVEADEAVWTLNLHRAGNDLRETHRRINKDLRALQAFLQQQGFNHDEVSRQPTRTVDKLARELGPPQATQGFRFLVTSAIVVRTANVKQVQRSLGATDELLNAGVILDGERQGCGANPRYGVARLNDLRPQLLAAATKNARALAQQLAADTGVSLGKIHAANQGLMQIFGSDGHDESGPCSSTSTPVKKIRLVSSFEFEIR